MPSLDLYGAIALTAAAAVFIFALAAGEPDPPAGRVRLLGQSPVKIPRSVPIRIGPADHRPFYKRRRLRIPG